MYLLCGLRSLISTLRKGRKAVPQNGQVLLRFESFAVQPAIISSSYTRQSHVLQSEQLDIRTCIRKQPGTRRNEHLLESESVHRVISPLNGSFQIRVHYLHGVIGHRLEAAGVGGGIWSVRSFGGNCQTT